MRLIESLDILIYRLHISFSSQTPF